MATAPRRHPEFGSEQEFLRHASRCLADMQKRAVRLADVGAGTDQKASAALARTHANYIKRLHDPDTVLFGRLDFKDGNRHYIGPRPIWDPEQELVAISWAAPAARPFYEASPSDPLGLTLRRRLSTNRDRLLGISDDIARSRTAPARSQIQLSAPVDDTPTEAPEAETVKEPKRRRLLSPRRRRVSPGDSPATAAQPEAPSERAPADRVDQEPEPRAPHQEPAAAEGALAATNAEVEISEDGLEDLLLQEIERDRTGEMRQVVATIQRDQYRIIERPIDSATVVQGGPGTGKTVVGLHRAALLLYRQREQSAAQRILIVGPNRVFMQYIALVLPSLGETAADQVVPDALVDLRVTAVDDPLVARVKGDPRMADVLRNALDERARAPEEDIEVSANGLRFTVPAETVRSLLDDARSSDRPFLVARTQFRGALERAVEAAYLLEHRRLRPTAVATPISGRKAEGFDRAVDRVWPSVSAAEVVRQLLSSEDRLERAAQALSETERRLIHRRSADRLEDVRWTADDMPLVDEVQALLTGQGSRYGHVVVDEAQDLTPMQLRTVGRRVTDGAVTILGDLAQATGNWNYSSWDEILRHLLGQAGSAEILELTLAYRVPREVMNLALPVLKVTAPTVSAPEPFRETGQEPLFVAAEQATATSAAIKAVQAARERGGSVGLIAPPALIDDVRSVMESEEIDFSDAAQGQLGATIELLDPAAAKGLEFDHVVLLEPAAILRESSAHGYRQLYVALTRATRTLTCVHAEPLPWPLGPDDSLPGNVAASGRLSSPNRTTPHAHGSPGGWNPSLTLDEALAIAQRRELNLPETLARALVAAQRDAEEHELVRSVLDPSAVSAEEVRAVLRAAQADRPKD